MPNDGDVFILGNTDGTSIGNTGTRLHVETQFPPGSPQPTIDEVHYRIHQGDAYYVSINEVLGSDDERTFYVRAPTVNNHMVFKVSSETITEIEWREDLTVTGSNADSIYNRDRNSANTPDTEVFKNSSPTATGGTLILKEVINGGNTGQGNNVMTSNRGDSEIILKVNTWYEIKVISKSQGNNVSMILDWYEV